MKQYQTLKKVIKTSDWTAGELARAIQMSGCKFSKLVNGTYQGTFTKKQRIILAELLQRTERYIFNKGE